MITKIYRPTVVTLVALATTIAAIAGTAGYILGRAPMLGQFVPVHFTDQGVPDRWLPISLTLVLLPVWIQLVLAAVFGSIGTLLLYRVPRADDVPDLACRFVENADGAGPFGAKGAGEGSLIPVSPAVANALARLTGVRLRELPLTPERVWRALRGRGPG